VRNWSVVRAFLAGLPDAVSVLFALETWIHILSSLVAGILSGSSVPLASTEVWKRYRATKHSAGRNFGLTS
jgi:hypothetical protein